MDSLRGHAQFFQRPAHAHVAGQALAAIGGGGEGSEDGTHREAPAGRRAWLQEFRRTTAPGIDIRSSACTSHARALYAGTDSDPSRWRGHPQKQVCIHEYPRKTEAQLAPAKCADGSARCGARHRSGHSLHPLVRQARTRPRERNTTVA
ncbi:hypothetical protein G6F40_015121 [Rhizopus arrhizus]|nr:hypothetical protein G6F40_015121 [Rhizopus arrhizus]